MPSLARSGPRCNRCQKAAFHFDRVITLGRYEGELRAAMLRLKRPGQEALGLAVGDLIYRQRAEALTGLNIDVIAPIPMHWRRRLRRSVNNPEILAEQLARRLRKPLATRLLVRQRNTLPQFELSSAERFRNVRRAFRPSLNYLLQDAHVLLVDDVMTTGATCSEAARCLRRAGAAQVSVVVAARTEHAA